ncbi:hypothetical protein DICPUDRAFT_147991 [Dictyostelium purpureum]|uniref:Galactokinase n=1 Tax=Dictyostelium purpureum TaxID=5786 RepID=F0Z9Y8_DICPU|nr:uncharacterized protein DICPUDRAFT_147991 [Dictyostelium purpureum]EGC39234.1 hypothetical protein DICPUDRAFT_147991 [Dictyostelium purpureum]|eukprot:XP_003284261.1 hypothetical protein DICPUDRAFT_147991 [Dictyostelium purpureum]
MDSFNPSLPTVVENLEDLYKNLDKNKKRYDQLKDTFAQAFNGDTPLFYFRAPGRVNLIGEHVDYSGYPVLPFALEQDTIVAVSFNKDDKNQLNIFNVNEKYTNKSVDISKEINIDMKNHHWTNYVLAAWKGVQQTHREQHQSQPMKSLNLLFFGNVPMGAGVSSSSALVCVSVLAFTYIHNMVFNKEELSALSIKSERFVGIESGGMDQTISFLGDINTAKLIEFSPVLKAHDVQLPKGVQFVICNSLVESNKVITGATNYNLRVVECRLAAVILAFHLGLKWESVRKLKDVQHIGNYSITQMVGFTEQHLKQTPYTREEVASILDITIEQLHKIYFPSGITVNAQHFELYKRAKHVFTETQRVYQFSETCKSHFISSHKVDDELTDKVTRELGTLMNQSHESCSKYFECSCPELDILTEICRNAGALGSRLTGAGWGGCVISLVPNSKVGQFLNEIDQHYYAKHVNSQHLPSDKSSYSFFTTPCKGASIVSPSSTFNYEANTKK